MPHCDIIFSTYQVDWEDNSLDGEMFTTKRKLFTLLPIENLDLYRTVMIHIRLIGEIYNVSYFLRTSV